MSKVYLSVHSDGPGISGVVICIREGNKVRQSNVVKDFKVSGCNKSVAQIRDIPGSEFSEWELTPQDQYVVLNSCEDSWSEYEI
jgi:hypothetical protein